jgi:pyruvate dehydrogenase E1 component beta subunit
MRHKKRLSLPKRVPNLRQKNYSPIFMPVNLLLSQRMNSLIPTSLRTEPGTKERFMPRITMREAISQALWEEMERDEDVFIMGEEVGVWGGTYAVTKGFYDHFGAKRVRDTPIAEAAIIGAAIGAALTGLRPVAELMTINFAFAAMDHIVNEAAKLRYMFGGQFTIPMVIRTPGGGGRQLGATHSQTPDAIFAHFPGLKVVAPGTPEDAKGMLKSAIRSDDPIMFIEHATLYQVRGEVPEEEYTIPLDKAKIQRPGNDVTLVTYSKMLEKSTLAAEELAKDGIEVEIVDLRCLRPLDMEPVLTSFKKTNRAVIVEEGWRSYGVGAEVSARIYEQAFDYVDAPIQRVAQKEVPLPYNRNLEQMALPQVEDVIKAVKEVL